MRKGLLTILAFGLLLSAGCSSANEKRTFTEEGKTEVTVQETLLETQNCQSVWAQPAQRPDCTGHGNGRSADRYGKGPKGAG